MAKPKDETVTNVPPVPSAETEAAPSPWEVPAAATTEAPAAPEAPVETPTEEADAPIADTAEVGQTPEVEKVAKATVTVVIPQAFDLTISHEQTKHFKAGIAEMEADEADHWYSIANGVKKYNPSV